MSESSDYHLAEYTSLHGEIRELNAEERVLEKQAIFATGVVWAWLAVHGAAVPWLAWCIPILFSVAGGIRAVALNRAVENIAAYIMKLERELTASSPVKGWETHRREQSVASGLSRSAKAFWILLLLITLLVPALIHFGVLPLPAA